MESTDTKMLKERKRHGERQTERHRQTGRNSKERVGTEENKPARRRILVLQIEEVYQSNVEKTNGGMHLFGDEEKSSDVYFRTWTNRQQRDAYDAEEESFSFALFLKDGFYCEKRNLCLLLLTGCIYTHKHASPREKCSGSEADRQM